MTTRRQFLKGVGAGLVLATVPGGVVKALAPEGDLRERPPWERNTWVVRIERLAKVGSGEHDWSWVECEWSDLREGDFYRTWDEKGRNSLELADDHFPKPSSEDSTRGSKPLRSVEILRLGRPAISGRYATPLSDSYDRETKKAIQVFGPDVVARSMPYTDSVTTTDDLWVRSDWSRLRAGDVFRVREPDGSLEAGEGVWSVCRAAGPYVDAKLGTWGVQVDPVEVVWAVRDGQKPLETLLMSYHHSSQAW